jgi:hypothetical protein
MGLGSEVHDGIIFNYSYSIINNVFLNSFGSHQLSLGIKLFSFLKKEKTQD